MEWEMHKAYADLICEGFSATEIEHLEDFGDYFFAKVDAGTAIELPTTPLILEVLEQYRDAK